MTVSCQVRISATYFKLISGYQSSWELPIWLFFLASCGCRGWSSLVPKVKEGSHEFSRPTKRWFGEPGNILFWHPYCTVPSILLHTDVSLVAAHKAKFIRGEWGLLAQEWVPSARNWNFTSSTWKAVRKDCTVQIFTYCYCAVSFYRTYSNRSFDHINNSNLQVEVPLMLHHQCTQQSDCCANSQSLQELKTEHSILRFNQL